MTKGQCKQRAVARWEEAKIAFARGEREDGWVHLLASGMCLAAANGGELNFDIAAVARDAGMIP